MPVTGVRDILVSENMEASAVQSAPGELELVRQFVNTNDVEDGVDALATPQTLGAWLSQHGLDGGRRRPTGGDVARAITLREALRALLLANNGEMLDPAAVHELNGTAADIRLLMRFGRDGGSALAPERSGVDGALEPLFGEGGRKLCVQGRLHACLLSSLVTSLRVIPVS